MCNHSLFSPGEVALEALTAGRSLCQSLAQRCPMNGFVPKTVWLRGGGWAEVMETNVSALHVTSERPADRLGVSHGQKRAHGAGCKMQMRLRETRAHRSLIWRAAIHPCQIVIQAGISQSGAHNSLSSAAQHPQRVEMSSH